MLVSAALSTKVRVNTWATRDKHDVAGAAAASVPVIFVAGGIEHEELGISPGELPAPEALRRLAEAHGGARPTHTVALARWDARGMSGT